MTDRDILLKKLSSVAFAMFEIRLFLDTHPDATEAIAKLDSLNDTYMQLRAKFEEKYNRIAKEKVEQDKNASDTAKSEEDAELARLRAMFG